ncbi:MAG: LacI family transcriptional regulator [Lachnospiraceae bacterium]|nr:LacI family transcriptional regulator [Lachnospiraceae bacterium]
MSLKKIAEMTGVSISTVSRVLNNRDYNCASAELKNRIWKAAEEIQYVPNESARNLKLGQSHEKSRPKWRFAVILERFESLDDDPFFRELFRSVEQEIFSNGCTISEICTASTIYGQSHESESVFVKSCIGLPAADGFIILGRSSSHLLEVLKKTTRNIVSINRNPTHFEIDEVICDGRAAAVCAMEYLVRKGDRHIGYIGDCSYENRYVGYCDTMIKNDLPIDYSSIFPTAQTTPEGYAAMKKMLLNPSIDAVFCANDATAIGAAKAYLEAGKQSMPQLDLISIDDIQAAQELPLPLTTVHIPSEDMGKTAVKILLDRIRKGHTEKFRAEFPSRLIIRESA